MLRFAPPSCTFQINNAADLYAKFTQNLRRIYARTDERLYTVGIVEYALLEGVLCAAAIDREDAERARS
jgi:hypothetical protein